MGTYYLQKVSNLKNVKETRYSARFDHFETKTLRDMTEHLAKHGFASPGVMLAAMSHLAHYMTEQLREGNKIYIEGIGEFAPSLAMTGFQDITTEAGISYVRPEGLHIDKVSFRPDRELLDAINSDLHVTRSKLTDTVVPEQRVFTYDERMTLLNQHYEQNHSITIKDYALLTHLPRTAANAELHRLALPDGPLVIEGSGTHIRFLKKPQK